MIAVSAPAGAVLAPAEYSEDEMLNTVA